MPAIGAELRAGSQHRARHLGGVGFGEIAIGCLQTQPVGEAAATVPHRRGAEYVEQLDVDEQHTRALADRLLESLGGHVVGSSVTTGEQASATMTVRVPVAKVQQAIAGLSGLGSIVSQQVTIDDLQEDLDALERRQASVRNQIARITARLGTGELDAETRAVLETRRQRLQRELRELRRGIAGTSAEARMSTIELTVVTPDAGAVAPTPSRLDRTLDEALNVLVWEGVIVLALAIVLAPLALLGLAAWLGQRLYRRREDERLLST